MWIKINYRINSSWTVLRYSRKCWRWRRRRCHRQTFIVDVPVSSELSHSIWVQSSKPRQIGWFVRRTRRRRTTGTDKLLSVITKFVLILSCFPDGRRLGRVLCCSHRFNYKMWQLHYCIEEILLQSHSSCEKFGSWWSRLCDGKRMFTDVHSHVLKFIIIFFSQEPQNGAEVFVAEFY